MIDDASATTTDDGEPIAAGLVRTVALIRAAGFSVNGTDEWDHSVDVWAAPRDVVIAAQRLVIVLAQAGYPVLDEESPVGIDAAYNPVDDWAMICVYGIDDAMLPEETAMVAMGVGGGNGKAAN